MTVVETVGFVLRPWQERAVQSWLRGTALSPFSGTLAIVTGGGKTLIALECYARASTHSPDLRLAVVVPTAALAHQWVSQIVDRTSLQESDVGLMGAGGNDSLVGKRAVVCVLNTASERLPEEARSVQPLMLVIDECHRAGAPKFSRVLDTPADFRLGLSATPDRDEFDEDGEPLEYDEQLVGRALGKVIYEFNFRDAREAGWLPEYTLNHHGIALTADERSRYDTLSRRVDDAADALVAAGGDIARARQLAGRSDQVGEAAKRWIALTSERKDLLFRAAGREAVAMRLVEDALTGDSAAAGSRAILFHERVDRAVELFDKLRTALPGLNVAVEHSRLPSRSRAAALRAFRDGSAQVLVSVKSLVEGIDVPEADVGVSVASTSSVRQRVQSLGRVMRRGTSATVEKRSVMHLIYVRDTVDELIYAKADWSDLTGSERNHYWLWPAEGQPEAVDGPPMVPRPTEDQVWDSLGQQLPATLPAEWQGVVVGQEYSIDTLGNVRNGFGKPIRNPQDVAAFVELVRGRPGGRFRVTPSHHLVIVSSVERDKAGYWLAGQLSDGFEIRDDERFTAERPVALSPGDPYHGPADKSRGTFKVGRRAGGVIERRTRFGSEIALVGGSGRIDAEHDAALVLNAWRSLSLPGMTFHINSDHAAWFEAGGERRFLAHVRHGFAFPEDMSAEDR